MTHEVTKMLMEYKRLFFAVFDTGISEPYFREPFEAPFFDFSLKS